ncbi:Dihydroorotate dehydrogenase-domain-containing protein [Auriculariales sp. MPI-PUGE-AT-0066]|nr:Dihydroorotate dehydrogenase-domain-containing protein [Auriculariales sp. MPI-PUGE-AT-0066]
MLVRRQLARGLRLQRAMSTSVERAPNAARTWLYGGLLVVGTGAFAAYYTDSRSAVHRYVVTPLLRSILDPEASHKAAVQALATGLAPRDLGKDDPALTCSIWNKRLSSPVGLAAGFDKDGEAVDGLLNLGFAWVEIGSVTPEPQSGNPKPRVFHLSDDQAIVNRYGFPSKGHGAMAARLRARTQPVPDGQLLAVNLGKQKTSAADSADDYVEGVRKFAPLADVLVVNVSSPNTPGLRDLQRRDALEKLLSVVVTARDATEHKPKLVLKVAPDLSSTELADIAAAVLRCRIDGVIVSNTTIQRPYSIQSANKTETGGLSGPPLRPLSLTALRTLRTHLPPSIPLIGCGGISTGADALEFAQSGASFVQLYTAFAYDGPGAPRRIKDELAALLRAQGTTWEAVVRASVDRLAAGAEERVRVREMVLEARALEERADRLGRTLALGGHVLLADVLEGE